jgi:hypothetical protein
VECPDHLGAQILLLVSRGVLASVLSSLGNEDPTLAQAKSCCQTPSPSPKTDRKLTLFSPGHNDNGMTTATPKIFHYRVSRRLKLGMRLWYITEGRKKDFFSSEIDSLRSK